MFTIGTLPTVRREERGSNGEGRGGGGGGGNKHTTVWGGGGGGGEGGGGGGGKGEKEWGVEDGWGGELNSPSIKHSSCSISRASSVRLYNCTIPGRECT